MIGSGRQLSVEAKQALLLWGQRLDVDLVLLMGVHRSGFVDSVVYRKVTAVSGDNRDWFDASSRLASRSF